MTLFIRANKTANNLCLIQVCGPKISRNTCSRILIIHSHLFRDLTYSHFDYDNMLLTLCMTNVRCF